MNKKTTHKEPVKSENKKGGTVLLFRKENYVLMLIGVAVITLGFFLMYGKEDIFSSTKITVAPLLVLLGFVIEVFAIFYKGKTQNGDV